MTSTLGIELPTRGFDARGGLDAAGAAGLIVDNLVPVPGGGLESRPGTTFHSTGVPAQPRQVVTGTGPSGSTFVCVVGERGEWFVNGSSRGAISGVTASQVVRYGRPPTSTGGTPQQYLLHVTNRGLQRHNLNTGTTDTPGITYDKSSPEASPKGSVCAITPGNRLAIGGFTGGPNGPQGTDVTQDWVWFSTAGDPLTYEPNEYVQLRPGDGEKIMGMAVYRDQLYVFKETAFWVFTGVSADEEGKPIFHTRMVDTGVGLAYPKALVATEHGLFFIGSRGVFVTYGGEPELVSAPLGDFTARRKGTYRPKGLPLQPATHGPSIAYSHGRLYVGLPELPEGTVVPIAGINDGPTRTFVYDVTDRWWSSWSLRMWAATHTVRGLVFADPAIHNATVGLWLVDDANRTGDFARFGLSEPIECKLMTRFADAGSNDVKRVTGVKAWVRGQATTRLIGDYGDCATPAHQHPIVLTEPRPQVKRNELRATTWALEVTGEANETVGELAIDRVSLELQDGARIPAVRSVNPSAP